MRSMWKGAVSFGLVSIPIQLYAATENHNVSFRQVHATDGGRVHYKRVCSVDGAEVPYAEIAKGYETPEGDMVVLTDDDLADLPLPTSRGLEVVEFVPLEAIDPICFDRSYYLEPQKTAVKPYVLLRDALQKSGHVAIAQVVLRQRETLAVLRVYSDVLVLTTMLWPDEVRTPDFAFLREPEPSIRQPAISCRMKFTPMPRTPGTLSVESPASACTSTTFDGATPNFSITSAEPRRLFLTGSRSSILPSSISCIRSLSEETMVTRAPFSRARRE